MQTRSDIALVQDWIVDYGGAENQLELVAKMFPGVDIYTLFDLRAKDNRRLSSAHIHPSGLGRLPFVDLYYRYLLPLSTRAIEKFDLSAYELIFSISSALAKGVIGRSGQTHLAYVNTPARYAWGMQGEYLAGMQGLLGSLKRRMAQEMLYQYRTWDMRTVAGVDLFLANSHFIRQRIWKTYRRRSYVLYPPVDTTAFVPVSAAREDYYVTASRLVPYKQVPLLVDAFASMPDKRLVVIGDGPEMPDIKRRAGRNVEIMGHLPFPQMHALIARARAFVFGAIEDFGIVPVEAQACGTPVIAVGKGGACETVRNLGSHPRPTGVLFAEQSIDAIRTAVTRFERHRDSFDPAYCIENAGFFSNDRFIAEVGALIDAGRADGFREEMVLGPLVSPSYPPFQVPGQVDGAA